MEAGWFVAIPSVASANRLLLIHLSRRRNAQALPHDRYLRVHEKSRLCTCPRGTYTDTWDLEKTRDVI